MHAKADNPELQKAKELNLSLEEMDLGTMDKYWNEAKRLSK